MSMPSPQPHPQPKKSNTTTIILVVCGVVGVGGICVVLLLVALLMPAINKAREAARRIQDTNNAKQILLALHNYESQYRRFPPAVVTDADGNPLYSWRVLILPQLEQQVLYDRFNLDEPWDSPANKPLSDTMLPIFRSASEGLDTPHTNFVAVVGEGTIWPPDGNSQDIAAIRDGSSNTAMIVQTRGNSIPWAAPVDLKLEDIPMTINHPSGEGIGSPYAGGALIGLGDAAVLFVGEDLSVETLRRLLLANDGQPIDYEELYAP